MWQALDAGRIDLIVLDLMLPGRRWPDAVPQPAREVRHPGHHAHRARRGDRPHRRPGDGRRRLPGQAVQPARAAGAHQGDPAPRAQPAAKPAPDERARIRVCRLGARHGAAAARLARRASSRRSAARSTGCCGSSSSHPNRVLNRDQLVDLTQGKEADPLDRSIDVQVSRLRHRLGDDPREPRLIKTVRGEGYVLAVDGRRRSRDAPAAAIPVRPADAGAARRADRRAAAERRDQPGRARSRCWCAASGMQPAQRIADIVKLLDSLSPAERDRDRRDSERAAAGGVARSRPPADEPAEPRRAPRRDVLARCCALRSATTARFA